MIKLGFLLFLPRPEQADQRSRIRVKPPVEVDRFDRLGGY